MRPLVGITQRLWRRRDGRERLQLDAAYARAVAEAGGLPLHLPIVEEAEAVVARVDALLVPGGPDFLPAHPLLDVAFDAVAETQLAFDRAVLAAAEERGIPFLGICYGMQLLALASGGSLHHHIPHDLPDALDHKPDDPAARHALRVESGARLATLLGPAPAPVNSRHHQAVADPGTLRVAARADDGVIEAVEAPGDRFVVGVQWHPERMDPPHRAALFGALVAAC